MLQSKLELEEEQKTKKSKRTQSGIATSDVILSSHIGDNSELFPKILAMYVKEGARIADVTYGTGVFWKKVDTSLYEFLPSDLKTGVDARNLPYEDDSLDAMVFDPPYMEGLHRKHTTHMAGGGSHDSFREYYSNGEASTEGELKYHDRVIDIYMRVALEAQRTLKKDGIFIVKCQDEVSSNKQKLTHVELIYGYEALGFYCRDLFVLTRTNKPVVARLLKQAHSRKNHSYFLVFTLMKGRKLPYSNFRQMLLNYKNQSL